MAYTVPRPKLTFAEKIYLPSIVAGMAITWKHFKNMLAGRTKVVMQYPEERWDKNMPEHYRGAPTLVTDDKGRERCVACQLCEFICPPRAIRIKPGEIANDDRFAKVEKYPDRVRYRHDPLHLLRHVRRGLPGAGDLPEKRLWAGWRHPRRVGAR
jgi:NADH-quinone oxidoreductase subunit I